MQNLPITTSQPATSAAQALTATDNGGDATAEPFNAVLARQIANSTATAGGPVPAALSAKEESSLLLAADDKSAKLPDLATNSAVGLSSDMLAALLPGAGSNGKAQDEGAGQKAAAPDVTAGALPDGLLAAFIPAHFAATAQGDNGVNATTHQTAGSSGKARPSVELQAQTELQSKSVTAQMLDNVTPTPNASVTVAPASIFSARLADSLTENTAQNPSAAQPDVASILAQSNALAASPTITAGNGPAQLAVDTPVGHDAWGGDFSQSITWLATQHEQTAELHLNPPQLGPLDVVLHVSGDQATALFTSAHPAVRDAVEQALPRLREMLAENGITLGNATVSDQSPRDQQPSNYRQTSGSSSGRDADIAPVGFIQPTPTAWPTGRQLGMVDTFV